MTFGEWYAPWRHPGMTEDELSVMDRCRAAWDAASHAEQDRCAASVRGVLAALRDKAGESMRNRDTGDALKALVECDGALLALAAIREGG